MARRSRPTVVLLAASDTLEGLDVACARVGIRLLRVVSLQPRPVPRGRWLNGLRDQPPPDLVVVTSRAAVALGVLPWLRANRPASSPIVYWAAGPTTARALSAARAVPVRRPLTLGAEGIARALARLRPRRILYLRSDRAGPALARRLRRSGHRVVDRVVYRVVPRGRVSSREARAVRDADALVASSPSALAVLSTPTVARRFGKRERAAARLVVLGARTRATARARGFSNVSIAPSPNPERFTRFLLRELEHAAP